MKDSTRVQLQMPQQAFERLKRIMARTEAVTYAEAVRKALLLYEGLINDLDNGSTIIVRDQNGNDTEYRVIL